MIDFASGASWFVPVERICEHTASIVSALKATGSVAPASSEPS